MSIKVFSVYLILAVLFSAGYVSGESVPETVVTVLERSKIPDPGTSDYPDCMYALRVRTESGDTIRLLLQAFVKRRISDSAKYQVGDRLACQLLTYDKVPPAIAEIQQADDMMDVTLESFFSLENRLLPRTETVPGVEEEAVLPVFQSVFTQPIQPPKPKTEQEARLNAIAARLDAVNERLSGVFDRQQLAKDFQRQWQRKQKNFPHWNKTKQIKLMTAGAGVFSYNAEYNPFAQTGEDWEKISLRGLKQFNEFLQFHQVDLLVVLIPEKQQVMSRIFMPEFEKIPDFEYFTIAKRMLEEGIEAVPIFDELMQSRERFTHLYRGDTDRHPDYGVSVVIAETLSGILKRYRSLSPNCTESDFAPAERESIGKNLEPEIPAGAEKYDFSRFSDSLPYVSEYPYFRGKDIATYQDNSEILLIGNSFAAQPTPNGLAGYIGWKSGIIPNAMLNGGGNGLSFHAPKLLMEDPDRLKGKAVCIMPVGIWNLKEGVWFCIKDQNQQRINLNGKRRLQSVAPEELRQQLNVAPDNSLPIEDGLRITVSDHFSGNLKVPRGASMLRLKIRLPHGSVQINDFVTLQKSVQYILLMIKEKDAAAFELKIKPVYAGNEAVVEILNAEFY